MSHNVVAVLLLLLISYRWVLACERAGGRAGEGHVIKATVLRRLARRRAAPWGSRRVSRLADYRPRSVPLQVQSSAS